ncbi:hypothetical protein LF65_05299 [Clostridium beijerinckii]|uniref:Uncharacterized protein n=1 Tax=Clostridium beijerinckii TaxID=1520 RepID=A0A0B5QLS1_CLOBE|nr:methyltransferase domain-containing protein [Clostridium beijerinckii]AJH01821.1 hypothetical protein LF65_05299 [Clostridium beijerinckii]
MSEKSGEFVYDRKIDFRENTADYFVVKSIFDGAKVLELGCSTGYITKYLNSEKHCENSAVEISKKALDKVSSILKYSINNDLNFIEDWIDKLPDNYFDFIVCQDVLEHLIDPFKVLRILKGKLLPRGKFLISIPNVSHNTILMQLLKNRFDYKDVGILDRTHIKFYTKETFSEEAKKIGLKRIGHYITYLVPDGTGWETEYSQYSLEERNILLKHGDGHVFQNLFILGKEECFCEEESPLYNLSLDSYDEVRIYEDNSEKFYYYKDGEELEYIVQMNKTTSIEIEATIRPCEYSIKASVNGQPYNFWSLSAKDGNINTQSGNFVNIRNQRIYMKHKFSKGDVVKIIINRKSDAIKTLMLGEICMNNELNKIKGMIDKCDLISFDIFDTLVLRNVLFPKDIFRLLDTYIKDKYGIENFYNLRASLETKTREGTTNEDVNIEEIYDTISKELKFDCNDIKEKELELEKKFIVTNPFMKEIFDYAKSRNKRIFIISDMYLKESFIKNILDNLGYVGYEKLFVSCELNKTKATKSIYKHIIKTYQDVNIEKWLHIGDNYQSDVRNPESLGINAYYYKSIRERANISDESSVDIKTSIMRAIQYNKVYCGYTMPYWEEFGIKYIAPIYYGLSDWIARLNVENNNVVFLSRDGYIPKLVFDKIKKKRKLDLIDSMYLYTSRKAYQLPSMAYMSKGEMVECLTQSSEAFGHKLTINEMFRNASLDINDYLHIIKNFGFDSPDDIINADTRHMAKKVIQFLYDDIITVLKKKCELVEEYFEQENLFKYDRLNIVDIGWRGSIQYSMQKMFNHYYESKGIDKKANIYGYYLGTNQFVYADIVDNTFGYYFDYSIPWVHSSFCIENLMMYEFIFTCPQPQLSGFARENGGKIIPIFRDFVENSEYTSALQNAALKIIDEFIDYDEFLSGISVEGCTDLYRNFIINRDYNDMIEFKKISNLVSYDSEEKPYVTSYSKSEIKDNIEKIWEETKFNLWRYAYLIDEIQTKEEFEYFMKSNNIERFPKDFNIIKPYKFFSVRNFKKAIKHPRKALKALLKKIVTKILQ